MFTLNDDLSIYATRGDIVFFSVCANEDGEPYSFKAGDVVRIKVFGKKDAENVVLQKDFPVTEDTTEVEIFLEKEDTKIGDVISKHKDYWYEIVLNDDTNPQTIIGYDDDGAKIFRLFPEGDDIPPFEPKPEDVRVMDDELDMTSTHPVQNQAVARAVTSLRADLDKTMDESALTKDRFDNLISIDDPTIEQNLEYLDYISEETKMKIGAEIKSDGVFATIKVNLREANLFYGGTAMGVFIIPKECRPINSGVIHTEDGLDYIINYDTTDTHYYLSLRAHDDVAVAPSSAGTVTFAYALGDYELKDIRVGADGVTYATAGEAIRSVYVASPMLTIDAGNYLKFLPSVNINKPSIYKLLFADGSTSIPTGLPFAAWEGGIATLVTTNSQNGIDNKYTTQILFTKKSIYYRYSGNDFDSDTPWHTLGDRRAYVKSESKVVQSSNYKTLLPTVNITDASIYKLLFAKGSKDIPEGLPFKEWEGVTATLITMNSAEKGSEKYGVQILFTTENIYYRYASTAYEPWINYADAIAKRVFDATVYVEKGGSILEGLKRCYDAGIAKLVVEAGEYDIIQEYEDYYGADYFENYDGYSGQTDKFTRGLWLENIEVVFSPGARVVCKYTGDNTNVPVYFSAFATGNNVTIDGLVLDSKNLRYGIHADYNTGTAVSKMVIRNCDLRHYQTSKNEQSIGAGFGIHVDWLIENTIFHSQSNIHVLRVHNNVVNTAQSKLVIRNCYIDGDGFFKFNYYSTSPYVSTVMVSGCSYATEPVVAPETSDSTTENIKLYSFNNELRTE